jgi:hypothetical protein
LSWTSPKPLASAVLNPLRFAEQLVRRGAVAHPADVHISLWPSEPWNSIHAAGGFSDLFARLDPSPRVRGKQFEHVQEVLMQGRFATGLFQGGDVLETADGQAQIEFG